MHPRRSRIAAGRPINPTGLPSSRLPARRRFSIAALAALSLLILHPAGHAQQTIHVPSDQPTIQAGINAAANGDTVLVAPGTYYEHVAFGGKSVTLLSSVGAAQTIIDGSLTGVAVSLGTTTQSPSVLDGFTVQNGAPTSTQSFALGGGVIITGSASVQNSTVTDNASCGVQIASPGKIDVHANHIFHNGYIKIPGNASGCRIDGTGIDDLLVLSSNFSAPSTAISHNLIENNAGSGITGDFENQSLSILGNTVRNNDGGGIGALSLYGPGIIANNLIYGNLLIGLQASFYYPSTLLIENNTVYANGASSSNTAGSATELSVAGAALTVVNNIFSHPAAATVPMLLCAADFVSPLPSAFDHNDFYTAGNSPSASPTCLVAGYGNRTDNPLFTKPASGDFHLTALSPEIDAGNNSAAGLPSTDFAGNPRIQDATGKGYPIVDIGAYESSGQQQLAPTIATLTACTSSSFSATVASPSGIPPGPVSLYMDQASSPSATATLDAGGRATFTNPATSGIHAFYISYSGSAPFTPAVSVVIYVSAGATGNNACTLPTTATLSALPNPATTIQPVQLDAQLSSVSGVPTGAVTFSEGATTYGTSTLNGSGSATLTIPALSSGTHTLTATYPATANFSATSATTQVTVTALPSSAVLSLQLNSSGILLDGTVTGAGPTATGKVAFFDQGTLLGYAFLNANGIAPFLLLPSGSHTFTCTYAGDAIYGPSSCNTITQAATAAPTTTTLTAAPNPTFARQPVTLTAAAAGSPTIPTGLITFIDGATAIGTANLDATGHATYITSTLGVGTHTLSAVYAGNSTYASSTSAGIFETILAIPQDFTLTLASPALTIQTQHHLTSSITLTSLGGFADSLSLACTNLPPYLTCRLAPSTASLAPNSTTTATLYLDTDSILGYAQLRPIPKPAPSPTSPISLALLFSPASLLATFAFHRRRAFRLCALYLALLPVALALTGCGSIVFPEIFPPSTAPGTYLIPITASGAASGLTHTVQLTLTITQ